MKLAALLIFVTSVASVALGEGRVEYVLNADKKVVAFGHDTNGNGKLDPDENESGWLAIEGLRDGQRIVLLGFDKNTNGALESEELEITLRF